MIIITIGTFIIGINIIIMFIFYLFIGISPGVGKSSLAATLSMALANMGKKVHVICL